MRKGSLADIFDRVQVNAAERSVLQAILSKTNIYGKHARIAHEVIQAITGLARSTVYAAIARLEKIRHLLRVERKVLWPGHNAINIYHVVIPWRADPMYDERKRMGWGKSRSNRDWKNNKGPGRPDPHTKQEEKSPAHAAHMCSEALLSQLLTPGSGPWYYAQDLTPPWEEGENGNGNGS
jgi:hypothetical protein